MPLNPDLSTPEHTRELITSSASCLIERCGCGTLQISVGPLTFRRLDEARTELERAQRASDFETAECEVRCDPGRGDTMLTVSDREHPALPLESSAGMRQRRLECCPGRCLTERRDVAAHTLDKHGARRTFRLT